MPTLKQFRPVSPLLTNFAEGYRNEDQAFIMTPAIFPMVNVSAQGTEGTFYVSDRYGDQEVLDAAEYQRGEGATAKRIDFGLTKDTYETKRYTMESGVDDRVMQNAMAPADPGRMATEFIMYKMDLAMEGLTATIVNDAASYGATAAASVIWPTAATADPLGDIDAGRQSIVERNNGKEPNTIIMNYESYLDLRKTDQLLATTVSGGTSDTRAPLSMEKVRTAIGIDNLIVTMFRKSTSNDPQAVFTTDYLILDTANLFYVDPTDSLFSTTFGKLFFVNNKGGAGGFPVDSYRAEDATSDIWRIEADLIHEIISIDCSYQITGVKA